ncbi:hypothetical protein E2C01_088073 [Portunus trituberculatus]|uniref:Uncharacterized protein n=1 Tax=Portunus trituberculatus TaxID=210409 RepID=A0A5B7JIW2_PORTR|nr:hypothetical protein [Portunus trituberculatus]
MINSDFRVTLPQRLPRQPHLSSQFRQSRPPPPPPWRGRPGPGRWRRPYIEDPPAIIIVPDARPGPPYTGTVRPHHNLTRTLAWLGGVPTTALSYLVITKPPFCITNCYPCQQSRLLQPLPASRQAPGSQTGGALRSSVGHSLPLLFPISLALDVS